MQTHFLLLFLWATHVDGFSWRSERTLEKPSKILQQQQQPSRLPNIYAVALSELQELESEPLCHRIAARLLVNNCQLVDGKDEATILTDSGRQVRDFIDSYAASLAICDLERGSFQIPRECAKFREPSLSQIAMRNEPRLHVSPGEIGLCLSALAASDAAWSTWVSYRHKALRFCEAARADNEKAQNILLYQRLTRIIAKLTDGVEDELQKRMEDLDHRARQSIETLEQLSPHIGRLSEGLARVERFLSQDVDSALRRMSQSYQKSLEHSDNLQHLLKMLVGSVLESSSQLAFAHEQSVQQATQRANEDMDALMAVVSSAIASSGSLQQQIQGMNRLVATTETLAAKFQDHSNMLGQANNLTNDILDTLEETVAVASSMQESFLTRVTTKSWWPFVVFPTASLVMGSYGLPPSMVRNIGLLAVGEVVGFVVSSYEQITGSLFGPAVASEKQNTTAADFL
ncbi:hypothetical protein VTJ83DRAFT_7150 [Remersonia thermophila]|uniref:Nuclear fusion protein KAR5 n=1 Tax=Remersonia thermophila TaxID=72144 RepID=A0ABR4D2N7_9PEZI